MSLYEEFRNIAINGNATLRVDRATMAVASSTIVTSLVDAVFTPTIGFVLGWRVLSDMFVGLGNPNSVAVPSPAVRRPGARRSLSVCSSMLL